MYEPKRKILVVARYEKSPVEELEEVELKISNEDSQKLGASCYSKTQIKIHKSRPSSKPIKKV